MEFLYVFVAMFFNVFLLGLNSKLLRDDRWAATMSVSWGISSSQFIYTRTVAMTVDPMGVLFWSALGASLGIGFSHWFYNKVFKNRGKKDGR